MTVSFQADTAVKSPLAYSGQQVELARLLSAAGQLQRWDAALDRFLPAGLAGRCHTVKIEGGALVVAAPNGGIAAKLRQLAPMLTQLLNQNRHDARLGGGELSAIRVVVQNTATVGPVRKEKPGLSKPVLNNLRETAQALPDGALKTALARMVRHHRDS